MKGNKLYQLADLMENNAKKTVMDRDIGQAYKFYRGTWLIREIIEDTILGLIPGEITTPIAVDGPYIGIGTVGVTSNSAVVKAKGTSTRLIEVKFEQEYNDNEGLTDLRNFEIVSLTNLIGNEDDFLNYLKDRCKRLQKSFDKKASKLQDLLDDNNIDIKTFLDMKREFDILDAQTRRNLYEQSKK